jgi:hypothetical protein
VHPLSPEPFGCTQDSRVRAPPGMTTSGCGLLKITAEV